jgi:hypothetical protein
VRAFERVRDLLKKMLIGRRLVPTVGALAAVHALMLVMRVNHRARLLDRCELPCGRPLMIDPDHGVKV